MAEDKRKKILIVEDEEAIIKVLAEELRDQGFLVLTAQNGEEGLKVALRDRPNLVLLDIVMPKMDGLTMLKKLREENEWGKYVPVIILTNLETDQAAIKAFDNLAYDFLIKSNNSIENVVKMIQEKLKA